MAARNKIDPGGGFVTDPYLSFRFHVEIKSIVVAGFSEVTGLAYEREVETFREGGQNLFEQQLPGATKYPSKLVLKRGLADADELYSWYESMRSGSIERKTVSILLLDPATDQDKPERWRWAFREAVPVKWTGPDFRAGTAEIAVESVELVHKGLMPTVNKKRFG